MIITVAAAEWLDARDGLFAAADRQNRLRRYEDGSDLCAAFQRVMDCNCADVLWLKEAFAAGIPQDIREAKKIFLALPPSPSVLCFAAMMVPRDHDHLTLLLRAADAGDAFANAAIASLFLHNNPEKAKEYALTSASMGEREGMYRAAECADAIVNRNNILRTYDNKAYKGAAEMGHALACQMYAYGFTENQPEYYIWFGEVLRIRYRNKDTSVGFETSRFLEWAKERLLPRNRALPGSSRVIHHMGEFFKKHQNTIFHDVNNNLYFQRVLELYGKYCECYRNALTVWTLFAKSLLGKDVRRIIAQMVWSSRSEALYDINEKTRSIIRHRVGRRSERLTKKAKLIPE